jgi:hypothetical protein
MNRASFLWSESAASGQKASSPSDLALVASSSETGRARAPRECRQAVLKLARVIMLKDILKLPEDVSIAGAAKKSD